MTFPREETRTILDIDDLTDREIGLIIKLLEAIKTRHDSQKIIDILWRQMPVLASQGSMVDRTMNPAARASCFQGTLALAQFGGGHATVTECDLF